MADQGNDVNLDQFMSEAEDGVLTLADDLVALPSLSTAVAAARARQPMP